MSAAVVIVWTPKGKVAHVASEETTLCGLIIGSEWPSEVQSEYAFVNTAKGACARCQKALRNPSE